MTKHLTLLSHSCLLLILCVISTAAQESPRSLVFDSPIERELSGGQIHTYTIRLTGNQIARVIVEQREIDIVVSVIAPDGVKVFEVDSPNGPNGWAGEEINCVSREPMARCVKWK